jgi:glycosyltransferase involved in cell wall biosynthesis
MSRELAALTANIEGRGRRRRAALRDRLQTLLRTLDGATPPESTRARLEQLAAELDGPATDRIWLALAVLRGLLPSATKVERTVRTAALRGPLAALTPTLLGVRPRWPWAHGEWPSVEVVTERVVVDLHHTARTPLATGIQRVARQAAQRWVRDHDPLLVGWTRRLDALRPLAPDEHRRALHGWAPDDGEPDSSTGGQLTVVVPWRCRYVLPELMTEADRAYALQALLRFSGSTGSMIGFDCVPISSGETSALGMGAGFSLMLSAAAYLDRIATISEGAATEYRGWRTMLAGAGLSGPRVSAVPLAVEAGISSPAALAEARELMLTDTLPMVLVVGSHEPRKNHLAVLHAAEVLWRRGRRFSLTFIGGNAWHSEAFTTRLAEVQRDGRPVRSMSAVSDDLLWAAYRLARCVLFPSLNEGFGLPVAESLACGTPVITSNFGSMREIADAGGGALLVDPRNDADIVNAMDNLLFDDELHAALAAEARNFPSRSWDTYAAQAWNYLVEGENARAGTGLDRAESR